MKRTLAFCLCFLLLVGCTSNHMTPISSSPDSSPEDTLSNEEDQYETSSLPDEPVDTSEYTTADIDYEWYLWGNTYAREDGITFFMNYGDEPLQIPNALSCEFDGVALASTTQINGKLVSDGILYSMEDNDGRIIEVLYSYTDDVIHVSDLRTDELNYSGDYYLAEDNLGQPLYPWYRDGEKLKMFYNSDTGLYAWVNINESLGTLNVIVEHNLYVSVPLDSAEIYLNDELGGYNYHYVYESNKRYVDIMYNSESDMLGILDASGADFDPSGFYYRIMM